jgi:hypothetical protein
MMLTHEEEMTPRGDSGPGGGNDTDDQDDESGIYSICAKEKAFRQFIERKLHQENFGKFLELISGFLAFGTSVSYVVLEYIEQTPDQLHSIFNKLDYVACCVFLFIYILKGYVATHRI